MTVTPEQAANTIRETLECPNQDAPYHTTLSCTWCANVAPARAALKVLEDAAHERDAVMRALGEPCAECGHIDWRSDDKAQDPLHEMAARADAAVRRAEQAERERDEWHRIADDHIDTIRASDLRRDEEREAAEAAEARADTLTRQRDELFHALKACAASAGAPDSAEACRYVIAIVKQYTDDPAFSRAVLAAGDGTTPTGADE